MKSILNKIVSYYPNYKATGNGVPVDLLAVLESTRHQSIVENLRKEPDEEKQKLIKSSMSCYTVAGLFSSRNNAGLITPSGLACVDLDAAEGYNTLTLLNELHKIPYIAYAGLSCRGQRLFLIVPFATGNYQGHYTALIQSFTAMGLPMGDNCHKAIAQPRIVSYNTPQTQWFNHSAKPYSKLPKPTPRLEARPILDTVTHEDFNRCVEYINRKHKFEKPTRHQYMVALAGYCKWKGLPKQITLLGCLGFEQTGFYKAEIKGIVEWYYK